MKVITQEQAIEILLKSVSEMTDEEVTLIVENRERFAEVKNSKEFWDAYLQSIDSNPRMLQVDGVDEHQYNSQGDLVKTVCVTAVIGYFGIRPSEYRRAIDDEDVARILRDHRYSVRSRKSTLKCDHLDRTQQKIAESASEGQYFYVSVRIPQEGNHAMLLDHTGAVVVDTAPSTPMWDRAVLNVKVIERT